MFLGHLLKTYQRQKLAKCENFVGPSTSWEFSNSTQTIDFLKQNSLVLWGGCHLFKISINLLHIWHMTETVEQETNNNPPASYKSFFVDNFFWAALSFLSLNEIFVWSGLLMLLVGALFCTLFSTFLFMLMNALSAKWASPPRRDFPSYWEPSNSNSLTVQ